nr:MAG TPA: hypothetical protein [Caudoviricetes sp.]
MGRPARIFTWLPLICRSMKIPIATVSSLLGGHG